MSASLERGVALSHYRILSALGAGGMGEVYEARDERLDRAVALKVLPHEVVQNEDRVRRFVQEAKSASGLNHPHIVTIYDIGHADPERSNAGETPGRPVHYIAMELVRGLTLRDKIHREQAPLKDMLRWMAQVAEGMAKAHDAGIVHRDLKPENVMISNDGFAKILDFGLAKLTERKTPVESSAGSATAVRNTREGAVLGTVGYMSPEQVQGRVVDSRSDVFSFGCMLYEATTRQKPFEADSDIETMHRILNATPQPVAELNPEVPSELRKMIRRCLAKDPERRYQSMKDLSLELFDLVEDFDELSVSTSSRSSSGSGSVAALAPRRPWILLGTIGALLAALAVAAVFIIRKPAAPAPASAVKATFTQLTDLGGPESQPALSPDGQYLAYVARPQAQSSDRDIFLLRVGGRNPINLTDGVSEPDSQPAFSPDGQSIAFRSERGGGGVFVMGATGESVRRISDFGFNPSWSPDGKKIVVSTEGGNNARARQTVASLWVIDVQTREKKKIYDGDAVLPRWSPHGQRIAFWALPDPGRGQRDILTIPAGGGAVVPVTDDPPLDWTPVWSHDGKWLYFASDRGGSMNLWRAPIDEATGQLNGPLQPVTTPSPWTGDLAVAQATGKIAYASTNSEANVHRIAIDPQTLAVTGTSVPVTTGSSLLVSPDVSPDGSMVVLNNFTGQEDIFVVRADGSELRKLTDDAAKDRGPRWSPDGKRIVFYSDRSGRYELWMIEPDGSNLRQISKTTSDRSVWFPEFSPDGRRVVGQNEHGTYFYSLDGPLPAAKTDSTPPIAPGVAFSGFSWSPDGKWLAGFSNSKGIEVPGTWLYSVEDRKYTKIHEGGGLGPGRVAWMPDSRHVVFALENELVAVDRVTLKVTPIFDPKGYAIADPDITADGRTIIFNTRRDEGDIWMATVE
jgi:serine/threonine protein kinase